MLGAVYNFFFILIDFGNLHNSLQSNNFVALQGCLGFEIKIAAVLWKNEVCCIF